MARIEKKKKHSDESIAGGFERAVKEKWGRTSKRPRKVREGGGGGVPLHRAQTGFGEDLKVV